MRSKDPELMESIKNYAERFYQKHLRSPYISEIAGAMKIARSTAHSYLVAMNENGMIDYDGKRILTNKIRKMTPEFISAELVGAVPCGVPETVEEFVEEYITLPASIFGQGDFYLLRASGDSMINAGIDSGDLVLIRKTKEAKEGDIVVALVDHQESTLKTLKYDREKGIPVLHPENDAMEDIPVNDLQIQGVAVNVIKSLVR